MHQLHVALEEDERLREPVQVLRQRINGNAVKHGLVVDLNPFWLIGHRLAGAGLPASLVREVQRYWDIAPLMVPGPGLLDLSRDFDEVDHMTKHIFGKTWRGPYLLRILARPAWTQEDHDARKELVRIALSSPLPTVIETEEPPTLVLGPSDKLIGPTGGLGTLGGFIKDTGSGDIYGVTCGHVAKAGIVTCSGIQLGPPKWDRQPIQLSEKTVCGPLCSQMTVVDAAVIPVSTVGVSNSATAIASIVTNGDIVEMDGAISGKRTYEVGGAVVELSLGGACWNRLHQVHAPTASIVPLSVVIGLNPPPQPGDSGAWLRRSQSEWAGMIIGRSNLHGYALAATTVISEAEFGLSCKLALL